MIEAVVFDLDGTLWDSSEQVIRAWNSVLEEHEELTQRLTPEILHGYMGKTIDVIAGLFFPELPEKDRMALVMKCIGREISFISQYGGRLYEGLIN